MFRLNFMWFVVASLWFFQLNEMFGQECTIMHADKTPYVMGMKKMIDVDLDEVDVKTLPIVFHVVHTGVSEENNISDDQILSQLDVLNIEFQDSKIQFCMATRTPDGEPTSGITRTDYSWNQEYLFDGVSNGAMGSVGADQADMKEYAGCWNPDEYINYYVVSEINGNDGGNGVQGFAYLGPTGDCRDGAVVLYNATGTVGEIKPGRTLGFTGVHEVGHYLSLWHTFSNSNDCIESNCETQGDQVCDTPVTLSNTGCSGASCPNALLENFMDYTSETCKESFTVGQSEKMHEHIEALRSDLIDNLSCVPVVDYDAVPHSAYYQSPWCTPTQDIWVDIVNQGTLAMDYVEVTLFCNGNQYSETLFDLPPGTVDVMFEQVLVDGADMFEVQVYSNQDQFDGNDYAYWNITTQPGDLLSITLDLDILANQTSWELLDGDGEVVIGDDGYEIQSGPYEYEVCVYDGCYDVVVNDTNGDGFCSIDFDNDGVCDLGSQGITGVINGYVVFGTEFGEEFDVWQQSFCNSLTSCELDYSGDGYVGVNDVTTMIGNFGCTFDCDTDPDGDGSVGIHDLLLMLANVGPCPEK